MSKIGKAIGRLFGVPKAPTVQTTLKGPPEDAKPAPLPTEDDADVRKAVLERERKSRMAKGRASTKMPGKALGSYPTTLG